MGQQFPGNVCAHTVFLLWISPHPCSDATPWVEQGQAGLWSQVDLHPSGPS